MVPVVVKQRGRLLPYGVYRTPEQEQTRGSTAKGQWCVTIPVDTHRPESPSPTSVGHHPWTARNQETNLDSSRRAGTTKEPIKELILYINIKEKSLICQYYFEVKRALGSVDFCPFLAKKAAATGQTQDRIPAAQAAGKRRGSGTTGGNGAGWEPTSDGAEPGIRENAPRWR